MLALRDKVGMHFSTHRSGTHTAVSDRRGWRRRWGSLNVFEVLRCLRVSLRHCESSQIQLNSTISKNTQKGSSWIFFRSSRALTCKLVGSLALAGRLQRNAALPGTRGRGPSSLLTSKSFQPTDWGLRPLARVSTILDHSWLAVAFSATSTWELLYGGGEGGLTKTFFHFKNQPPPIESSTIP